MDYPRINNKIIKIGFCFSAAKIYAHIFIFAFRGFSSCSNIFFIKLKIMAKKLAPPPLRTFYAISFLVYVFLNLYHLILYFADFVTNQRKKFLIGRTSFDRGINRNCFRGGGILYIIYAIRSIDLLRFYFILFDLFVI